MYSALHFGSLYFREDELLRGAKNLIWYKHVIVDTFQLSG